MRFASISNNKISVSDWSDCKEIHHYTPKNVELFPINTISWSKNGIWLVYVQRCKVPAIVSLDDRINLLYSINTMENATCATFPNATKRNIAIGTTTGRLVIYDVKDRCIKRQLPTQQSAIFGVQYTANDSHLISGCEDGKVYVYKNVSCVQIAALTVPKSTALSTFRSHPTKLNMVGLGSVEGNVAVYDFNVSKPVAVYCTHSARISDLAFKQDQVFTIGYDRRMCVCDFRTDKLASELSMGSTPSAFDLNPNGFELAMGFANGEVLRYDLRSMKQDMGVVVKHDTAIKQIAIDKFSDALKKTVEPSFDEPSIDVNKSTRQERSASFSDIYCDQVSNAASIPNESNKLGANTSDSFLKLLPLSNSQSTLGENVEVSIENNCNIVNTVEDVPQFTVDKNNKYSFTQGNQVTRISLPQQLSERAHSTPLGTQKMISPIFSVQDSGTKPLANTLTESGVRRIFREELAVVKEAVQKEVDAMRDEMRDNDFRLRNYIFTQTSNLLWTAIKQNVELNERLDALERDLFPPSQSRNSPES